MSANYRRRKKKIIFFGDSITEAGALFGGFIQRIATYLQDEDIAHKYDLVGMGKGGNKVTDLQERLGRDILEKGCDMVVMFIGVNDVWHKFTHNTGTDAATFEHVYTAIVERIKSASIKLVLCTPAVIGEKIQGENIADSDLDQVCDIIRKIALDYELPLVDLRKTFTQYLLENNIENMESGLLTRDGVHLNEKGNQMVANEIWTTIKGTIASTEKW